MECSRWSSLSEHRRTGFPAPPAVGRWSSRRRLITPTIGKAFFGWKAVVAATPPLTGGIVASILMAETAAKKGLPTIALLATCMYIMQGLLDILYQQFV